MPKHTNKFTSYGLIASVLFVSLQAGIAFAANTVSLSQVISDGVQAVDFVDGSNVSIGSPSVSFAGLTFSTSSQTATGTLGAAGQKLRVSNPTSDATWTVSIAATGGATAAWTSGADTYDFNDTGADGSDDADSDSIGGRLTVNPAAGTVAGSPDDTVCSPSTGITKGSSAAFREIASAVSSITILTGGGTATPYCTWDMTGIALSQVVPASQVAGTYTLGFTVSIL